MGARGAAIARACVIGHRLIKARANDPQPTLRLGAGSAGLLRVVCQVELSGRAGYVCSGSSSEAPDEAKYTSRPMVPAITSTPATIQPGMAHIPWAASTLCG